MVDIEDPYARLDSEVDRALADLSGKAKAPTVLTGGSGTIAGLGAHPVEASGPVSAAAKDVVGAPKVDQSEFDEKILRRLARQVEVRTDEIRHTEPLGVGTQHVDQGEYLLVSGEPGQTAMVSYIDFTRDGLIGFKSVGLIENGKYAELGSEHKAEGFRESIMFTPQSSRKTKITTDETAMWIYQEMKGVTSPDHLYLSAEDKSIQLVNFDKSGKSNPPYRLIRLEGGLLPATLTGAEAADVAPAKPETVLPKESDSARNLRNEINNTSIEQLLAFDELKVGETKNMSEGHQGVIFLGDPGKKNSSVVFFELVEGLSAIGNRPQTNVLYDLVGVWGPDGKLQDPPDSYIPPNDANGFSSIHIAFVGDDPSDIYTTWGGSGLRVISNTHKEYQSSWRTENTVSIGGWGEISNEIPENLKDSTKEPILMPIRVVKLEDGHLPANLASAKTTDVAPAKPETEVKPRPKNVLDVPFPTEAQLENDAKAVADYVKFVAMRGKELQQTNSPQARIELAAVAMALLQLTEKAAGATMSTQLSTALRAQIPNFVRVFESGYVGDTTRDTDNFVGLAPESHTILDVQFPVAEQLVDPGVVKDYVKFVAMRGKELQQTNTPQARIELASISVALLQLLQSPASIETNLREALQNQLKNLRKSAGIDEGEANK